MAFDGVFDFLEVEVSGAESTGFLHGVADAAVFFETGVAFDAFEFAAVVVEDDDGGEAADFEVFLEAFDGGHAGVGEAWGASADGFEDGGEDEVSAGERPLTVFAGTNAPPAQVVTVTTADEREVTVIVPDGVSPLKSAAATAAAVAGSATTPATR